VVTFSEPGTHFEEEAAEMLLAGDFTKPLFSFIAGRFTESLPEGTVFGHAGAMISGGTGKPSIDQYNVLANKSVDLLLLFCNVKNKKIRNFGID
jgi:succinyl-CoA synthetase alpha subunit